MIYHDLHTYNRLLYKKLPWFTMMVNHHHVAHEKVAITRGGPPLPGLGRNWSTRPPFPRDDVAWTRCLRGGWCLVSTLKRIAACIPLSKWFYNSYNMFIYYIMLYYIILYYVISYYIIIVSCYIILYYIISYYTIYHIILYYIILYDYIILH